MYIGTLQPRKNIPLLIEAYAKIKNKIPEIKLVLAGNKNGHNFDKKINEVLLKNDLNKDIIFAGFIDTIDKVVVYKMATVYVFPSFYEGFGIPILEAMSQGVPVLASDIPPHRELVTGLHFEEVSVPCLNRPLLHLKREEISPGHLKTWDKVVAEMVEHISANNARVC